MSEKATMNWVRRRWPVVGIGLAAVIALALVWWVLPASRSGASLAAPTFLVQEGPLTISVTQSGSIRALEQEIIKSEVEGMSTIIRLVPEGTVVKEDDLLVELDSSSLADSLIERQILLQNAEATYISATENLKVVQNQSASDVSLAELNYRFAQEDLVQYREGELKNAITEAEQQIKLAEEQLKNAEYNYEWSKSLHEDEYLSFSELETDRLQVEQLKLNLDLKRSQLQLLTEFTSKRQLDQLTSDVEQTQMALERARLKAAADIIQAEATLKAREAEFNQQKAKHQKLVDQIAKTKITAPRAGLVVYATSARQSWRGNEEPLDEGAQVRERQELIYLPTADQMMAIVQVHESNLDKLRLGLPVVITVDALPGKTYFGKVAKIAPLPDAQSMWMNPDLKVFATEIHIEGSTPELRTGMSCQAEIIVEQYDTAVYAPVQAIVRIAGTPTAYVRQGDGFVPRPVEIGMDNNRMIRVLSGLTPGEEVSLAPPLESTAVARQDAAERGGIDRATIRASIEDARSRPRQPTSLEMNEGMAGEGPGRGMGPGMGRGDAAAGMEMGGPGMEGGGGQRRPRGQGQGGPFGNLTDEQREEMRRRFESMPPEQRDALRRQFMGGGAPGGTEAGPGGFGPGQRPERPAGGAPGEVPSGAGRPAGTEPSQTGAPARDGTPQAQPEATPAPGGAQ